MNNLQKYYNERMKHLPFEYKDLDKESMQIIENSLQYNAWLINQHGKDVGNEIMFAFKRFLYTCQKMLCKFI